MGRCGNIRVNGASRREEKRKDLTFSYAWHVKRLLESLWSSSCGKPAGDCVSTFTPETPIVPEHLFRETGKPAGESVNLCVCYTLLVKILLARWLHVCREQAHGILHPPQANRRVGSDGDHDTNEERWATNLGREGEKQKETALSCCIFFIMSDSAIMWGQACWSNH